MFFTETQLGTVIPEVVTAETLMDVNAENMLKVDPKLKEEKQNQINFKAKKKEMNDDLYSNDDDDASMSEIVVCLKEKKVMDGNEKVEVEEVVKAEEVKGLNFEKKSETDTGKKRIKLVPL